MQDSQKIINRSKPLFLEACLLHCLIDWLFSKTYLEESKDVYIENLFSLFISKADLTVSLCAGGWWLYAVIFASTADFKIYWVNGDLNSFQRVYNVEQ